MDGNSGNHKDSQGTVIMKPVEYVSIGGYAFSMEQDACSAAGSYLDELESFYLPRESGSEIMEEIEERMADLLIEKC